MKDLRTYILLLCIGLFSTNAICNQAGVAEQLPQKAVTLCYVPWWVDWRLPSPVHADLPLQMINPSGWEKQYKTFEEFETASYFNTIKNLERAGIDVICWDTFGKEQVRQSCNFLAACAKADTTIRLVPYLDVHEAVNPDLQNSIQRFETLIKMYEKDANFAKFYWDPYMWTWGTRNLSPDVWEKVFAGLREKGLRDYRWVAHLSIKPTEQLNKEANGAYFPTFYGAYSWQPSPLPVLERDVRLFKNSFQNKKSTFIGSVFPMFRRYGYGINCVLPEGFQLFRRSWEESIKNGAAQIHLVTWNDYEEDTMIMPTVSRGFSLVDINAYFSGIFRAGNRTVDRSRIFVAFPRSGLENTESYIDVTGIYAVGDLPYKLSINLRNEEGKVIATLPGKEIKDEGIQSALFHFPLKQKNGLSYKPEIVVNSKKGRIVLGGGPGIDVYDPGALRDRNIWMLSDEEISGGGDVTLLLANDSSDFVEGSLNKAAKFTVTVPKSKEFDYLVLKRNGEQAAVIRRDGAYLPTGAVGGDWGWSRYAAPEVGESAAGLAITFPESPSRYSLPPDGGGEVKRSRVLTKYARDWYSIIAVNKKWQRSFSNTVVVKRGEPDARILECKEMRTGIGTIVDDTLKGFDIKDFSKRKPNVVAQDGALFLRVTPEYRFLIPNESLAGPNLEVNLDFVVRGPSVTPVSLLWSRSGELQLFIDKDAKLVARTLIPSESGDHYASVSSKQPLLPENLVKCKVVIQRPGAIILYVNEELAGEEAVTGKLYIDSKGINIVNPLTRDMLDAQSEKMDSNKYTIDISWIRIMAR